MKRCPLYIADEAIEKRLGELVAGALKAIKYEIQDRAVTPSFALGLMKKHFQPLLPTEHQDILGSIKKASWGNLNWASSTFIFREGKADGLLSDIRSSIDFTCKYSTYPPREWPHYDKIENNIFLQTCRTLKIDVANLRYLDEGKFDIFRACK